MKNVFRRTFAAMSGLPGAHDLLRDKRANFAVTAALLMVPIMGAVGLAADYTEILRTRSHIADSLDAAAFTAADGYARKKTVAAITDDASRVFYGNLEQTGVDQEVHFFYDGFFVGEDANFIRVRAVAGVEPRFMPILWQMLDRNGTEEADDPAEGGNSQTGGATINLGLTSEVAVATSTVELALVLDNSGSMAGSKISALKTAASTLVEDLFGAVAPNSAPDAVKFSVVPFAGAVNIDPANKNAAWIDTEGRSSVHHENFDWTTLSGASKTNGIWKKNNKVLSRFWLFDQVQVAWGGCVEARPYPMNVQDTAPVSTNADTLFVPMFAPDAPNRYRVNNRNETYLYTNSYIDDFLGTSGESGKSSNYNGDAQHRRQSWMRKYEASGKVSNTPLSIGPNYACTSVPVLPLSDVKKDVLARLNQMKAEGATNIAEGAAWGLRTLSPQQPFVGGREYGHERNIKAMVVMSDGENTYYTDNGNPNESTYGPYGFSENDRIFDGTSFSRTSDYSRAMDSHLAAVCTESKAQGVIVFTIAFDVANNSPVKKLLENCASLDESGRPNYFDASSNQDLQTAFGAIGSKVSGIRLYR